MSKERKYVGKLSGFLNNPKKELNKKQDQMKPLTSEDVRNMIPTADTDNNEEEPELTFEIGSFDELQNNWNYELDNVNKTVTLNYYTGSDDGAIVYANYQIFGSEGIETYKTLLRNYPYEIYMFYGRTELRSIIFSKYLDTSYLTNISSMFRNCKQITSLDLSMFNPEYLTSMFSTFNGCSNLSSINLTSLNTSNVNDMDQLFAYCPKLEIINVSRDKWIISSNCSINRMFDYCGVDHVTYVD